MTIENHAQEHAYEPSSDRPGTPFPFPGNKTRLAGWILQNTRTHETFVTPFAGSCGVLFQKRPSRNEVINDCDSDITTFYRVLRDRRDELKEYLSLVPYSEEQYNEWKEEWDYNYRPNDEVKHAAQFYYLQRASFGADRTGFRATANGRRNSSRQFFNSLDRLDDFSDRLEGVIIHNKDYVEIIEKYAGDEETLFYFDPPYEYRDERYDVGPFERLRFGQWMGELSGEYDSHWMVSSIRVPKTIGCYPTVETDLVHQINNQDGDAKTETEKLTLSYHPDEEEIFTGDRPDQVCLQSF
jgi:DNA adenine methylase